MNKIKKRLGLDQAKLLMSSGAPIARNQLEFFGSLGLHIMESFGATYGMLWTANHGAGRFLPVRHGGRESALV